MICLCVQSIVSTLSGALRQCLTKILSPPAASLCAECKRFRETAASLTGSLSLSKLVYIHEESTQQQLGGAHAQRPLGVGMEDEGTTGERNHDATEWNQQRRGSFREFEQMVVSAFSVSVSHRRAWLRGTGGLAMAPLLATQGTAAKQFNRPQKTFSPKNVVKNKEFKMAER